MQQRLDEGRNAEPDMRAMGAKYVKAAQRIKEMILALPPEDPFRVGVTNHTTTFLDGAPNFVNDIMKQAQSFDRYDRTIWAYRWLLLGGWRSLRSILNTHSIAQSADGSAAQIVKAMEWYDVKLLNGIGVQPDTRLGIDYYSVRRVLTDGIHALQAISAKTKIDLDTLLDNSDFDPKTDSPSDFAQKVVALREKYAAEMRGDIRTSNKAGDLGEVALQYEDGSAWVSLDCSSSDLESELMHHCGRGSGTLYSYRVVDPKTKQWKPLITVDVNDDGNVAQVRGPSNKRLDADEVAKEKLVDLMRLPSVSGLTSDAGIEWDSFEPEQQDKIQAAHKGKFEVDVGSMKCDFCEGSFDPDYMYHCETCDRTLCSDCEPEHLWGKDNTDTYWVTVNDELQPDSVELPKEWEDSDEVIKDHLIENEYWALLKDLPSSDRRKAIELYKGDTKPAEKFIYAKDGRKLGHDLFGDDFEQEDGKGGYEPDEQAIASWIHDEYGPDVDIEDHDRQRRKDAQVASGKQPLLWRGESVRDVAVSFIKRLRG